VTLAGWDPDAIERVRQEVRPDPRDADELHDLPMTVVGLRPIQDWRRWLDELVEEHRALTVYGPRAELWCAVDRMWEERDETTCRLFAEGGVMKVGLDNRRRTGITRRQFLGGLGAGATAIGVRNVLGPDTAEARAPATRSDRFSRMFDLPPFAEASPSLEAALREIGRPGGLLDATDALERGPVDLIVDPALSANNPNNPAHTAGTTFMGQFMDHDMTFDIGSALGVAMEPRTATNGRTPSFDLDSMYGGGPTASPQLYEADRARLRVESGGRFEDLPRTSDNTAIIADPRNDEHAIIAGLHAAFLLFHNRAVEVARGSGPSRPAELFAQARRLTTWHYQWMVLHEFLPLFVGQGLVDDIVANGPRYYRPGTGEASIPVEFQGRRIDSGTPWSARPTG
jgi:hypothetical protein